MHLSALVPACLVGAALLSSPAWSAYDLQNYYPLAAGNSWTYLERDKEHGDTRWNAGVKQEQIASREMVNGVSTWRLDATHGLNDNSPRSDNVAWTEEGAMLYRMEGDLCTTPLMLLPRQLEIGEPRQSSADCGGGGATITHTLLGVENVSVEAGNFSNCLKVRLFLQGSGWSSDETQWLCPNVGKVKSTWTDVEDGMTHLNSYELRWASVGGIAHGGERTVGAIRTAYAYGHFFEDSTLEIYNLTVDGQPMSARFGLDPARIFFAYKPQGGNGTAFPGVGLSNAYIRMNGTDLTIYDLELSGTKYLTTWELQTSPEIGFVFKDIVPMPQ